MRVMAATEETSITSTTSGSELFMRVISNIKDERRDEVRRILYVDYFRYIYLQYVRYTLPDEGFDPYIDDIRDGELFIIIVLTK